MACERDRIVKLAQYVQSCGIEVNICKNKARGNKGYFRVKGQQFRIDIARNQSESVILGVLAHEFAHYVHYNYDRTLKSLNFIFDNDEGLLEELLKVTVDRIPKKSVQPMFDLKQNLKSEINELSQKLSDNDADINAIEYEINKTSLKYLLKHDNVKIFKPFGFEILSVNSLTDKTDKELYIKLKSKQRALNRINSKISRLNRYYNSSTELFAVSFEQYVINKQRLKELAPQIFSVYEKLSASNKVPLLSDFIKNLQQT